MKSLEAVNMSRKELYDSVQEKLKGGIKALSDKINKTLHYVHWPEDGVEKYKQTEVINISFTNEELSLLANLIYKQKRRNAKAVCGWGSKPD